MEIRFFTVSVCFLAILLVAGCSQQHREEVSEIKSFSLDSMEGVITRSGVELDGEIRSEGESSLKITTEEPSVVRLFEVRNIDAENARLIYQAKLRSKDLDGKAYLEMWCHFQGKGEFFSRSLQNTLTGTTDWTSVETPFFLEEGQNPDYVKLNLVVDGSGTVWMDDIRLIKGPSN